MLGKMVKDGVIESPRYGYYKLPAVQNEKKVKMKLKPMSLFDNGKSGKTVLKESEIKE
jgi:hypothetical protein